MKSIIALFLYLFLPGLTIGQTCIKYTEYKGPRGSIVYDSVPTVAGSILFFDFTTFDVPDKLTIFTCAGDSISFYTGAYLDETLDSKFLPGFSLVEIDEFGVHILYTDSDFIPKDFGGTKFSTGIFRLIYHTSCCSLKWKIEGNKREFTVFNSCVQLSKLGTSVIDTIEIPHCLEYSEVLVSESCGYVLYQYIDSSVQIFPITKNPTCYGISDGYIVIPGHAERNLYNLNPGIYSISIANSICQKEFLIRLVFDSICKIYIPNVFSPNDDGINDVFLPLTDYDSEYELFIYSRWGELVYRGTHITNQTGWNPQITSTGVYTYRILLDGQIFTGDITLLR